MNNVILIHGKDTYTSLEALKKIKQEFLKKHGSNGELNLSHIEAKNKSLSEIKGLIETAPFLAEKRLMIINHLLKDNLEVAEKLIDKFLSIPASTLLILYERNLDKRLKISKEYLKKCTVKEFPILSDNKLQQWIRSEANKQASQITPGAVQLLIDWVGPDLSRMKQEIIKLGLANQNIDKDLVKKYVAPKSQVVIFSLADAVSAGQKERVFPLLDSLRNQGEPDLKIFAMILSVYRNVAILYLAQKENITQSDYKTATKLHPFVIQKTIGLMRHISFENIKEIYNLFLNLDYKIKSGKIEADSAVDLLVLKLMRYS